MPHVDVRDLTPTSAEFHRAAFSVPFISVSFPQLLPEPELFLLLQEEHDDDDDNDSASQLASTQEVADCEAPAEADSDSLNLARPCDLM